MTIQEMERILARTLDDGRLGRSERLPMGWPRGPKRGTIDRWWPGERPAPREVTARMAGDGGARWRAAVLAAAVVTAMLALSGGCRPSADDDDDSAGDPSPAAPWPEWAFRHWVWEDESTQESATTMVEDYLDRGIDVGAIIIDSPWETGYNTFVWDTERFPDPQGFIDEMHAADVRVFLWITPAINTDVEPLYGEAADAGYFMLAEEGGEPAVVEWWKGEGSLIDYFNPEAVAWWHGLMDPVLDMGIDGWKTDGLDFAAILADYSPGAGREVERLEYSHAYYRDFFDYTRQRLGDDRLITARPNDTYGADIGGDLTAFAPVDINWAAWVGDQDADFTGLQAALLNMVWSSDYGYVAFGSDIGGYRDDGSALGRDKETFIRWAQLGAFCPVMENGGGGEHRPWMFDEETADIYRDLVDLHHALLPYLMEEGGRAFAEGTSLMTFLDEDTFEYMLGRDVFVAPMIEPGTSRQVTFPADGDWQWLYGDRAVYSGGTTATLEVPLDAFPAFVRVGADVADELNP